MDNLRIRYNVPLNAKPAEAEAAATAAAAPPPPAPNWWDAVERPAMTGRTRLIIGGALGALCLLALLWCWRSALLSLAAGIGLGAALRPPVNWLVRKNIPYLRALLITAGGAGLLLAVALLGLLPAWQRQAVRYGQHLTELAQRGAARTAALQPAATNPPAAAAATHAVPAASATNAAAPATDTEALQQTLAAQRDQVLRQATAATAGMHRWTQAAAARLQRATATVAGRRWSLFFQLLCCSAVFLALPLLLPHEAAPAPGAAGRLRGLVAAGYGRVSLRFSQACGGRIVKAAALALLTLTGLAVAGFDVALFVAGIVGGLTLVLRWGPSLGLVLALPMIPLTPSVPLAIGIVAALWVGLTVAEKKLFWYLQYLPALKAGWMPPPPAEGGGAFRGLFGGLAGQLVRGALSLVFLLALAGFLYCVVPPFLADEDRAADLREAAGLYNTNLSARRYEASIANYKRLLQHYPHERVLMEGLARSYTDAGDWTNALTWADNAANWQPPPPTNTLPMQIYRAVIRLRAQPQTPFQPEVLYEYLARHLLSPDRDKPPPELGHALGERLLKLNPHNAWGHLLLVTALVQEKNYAAAVEHARQGLAEKNSDTQHELEMFLKGAEAAQQGAGGPPKE